jgi:acyl dehydratase
MAIDYPAILDARSGGGVRCWAAKDTILYALGLGLPHDPLDPAQLAYVDERRLTVMPSFAAVLERGIGIESTALGLTLAGMVHAEQAIEWHSPLAPEGAVTGEGRVIDVADKGDKGAVVTTETLLRDADNGAAVATIRMSVFARRDGHFGGPADGLPPPPSLPDRMPDERAAICTTQYQPALYRLSGDLNALHIDPETARRAGFDRPILHGLCSYGMVAHNIVTRFAGRDPARLAALSLRFSAPVYPGETLAMDYWRDGDAIAFVGRVAERGVIALGHGRARLR